MHNILKFYRFVQSACSSINTRDQNYISCSKTPPTADISGGDFKLPSFDCSSPLTVPVVSCPRRLRRFSFDLTLNSMRVVWNCSSVIMPRGDK